LRVARGLFRLWLVLSVLWIGGVGVVTWQTFPEDWGANDPIVERPSAPSTGMFDDLIPKHGDKERWEAIRLASVIALLPPAFVLALGSALVWALKGFRD
jgi:hypothetical protein